MALTQEQGVNQWKKIKDPKMNTHNYNHLILNKDTKIYTEGNIVFSTNGS